MNLFFDLDGTLLDSRNRLYLLFRHLVPLSEFSFDTYWNLKRDKINHHKILSNFYNYSEQEILQFEDKWMNLIESDEWLALDVPNEGASELLNALSLSNNLYIVTARQFKSKVHNQIMHFKWQNLICDILVTEQKKEKFELIKEKSDIALSKNDWLIGDTGKDIETGKILGIRTIAFTNGFLNDTKLKEYNPTKITASLASIKNIVNE